MGRHRIPTNEKQLEMINRYHAGESLKSIGASFSVSKQYVGEVIKRHSVQRGFIKKLVTKETEKREAARARMEARRAEWRQRITRCLELIEAGRSAREIAYLTGTHYVTVGRWLRQAGWVCKAVGWQTHKWSKAIDSNPVSVKSLEA